MKSNGEIGAQADRLQRRESTGSVSFVLVNNLVNYDLNETFAALANATRRAILARLADGEATVKELAEPFEMSLPAVSRHIRVLESAGLIEQGQRAQFRPCTINAAPLEEVSAWAEQYRTIWQGRFDRMDNYVSSLQTQDLQTKEKDRTEQ